MALELDSVQTLVLLFTICVTLANYIISVSQSPSLGNGDESNGAYLIEFL